MLKAFKVFVVVMLLFTVVTLVYAQANPETKDKSGKQMVVNEDLLISWGVVVALLGCVSTFVIQVTESKNHRGNAEIHHTNGSLMEKFSTKEDCVEKHKVFDRLISKVDKMAEEITEIKILLGGKH